MPSRTAAICLWALCLSAPGSAQADFRDLPGGPPEREGSIAVGAETGLVVPLSTDRLCPPGYQCVADVGWAIGVDFSYRWKKGFGLGFGYELWLLTANGVYAITVPQLFTASLRYSFLPDRRIHPLVRLRGGFAMLGPSFRVATVGGMAEIGIGGEVEVTSDTAFSFLLTGDLLRTGSFVTPSDGASRGIGGALDAMLVLRLGFHFLL